MWSFGHFGVWNDKEKVHICSVENGELEHMAIPEICLSSGNAKPMPVLGLGLGASDPTPEVITNTKKAVLDVIELGYRMFDTAAFYQTEYIIRLYCKTV